MEKAYHFALLARAAYLDDTPKKFKELGYTGVKFYDNNGAEAYVAWNKEQITVAFRGTEPKEFSDIKADLNAVHYQGFHKGFYIEYLKNSEAIEAQVDELLKKKERPVYVCGHSLGGGIATIFSHNNRHIVTELYTYGSPRAITWWKAEDFTTKHYRFRNNNDVVPTVPFWIMGFKHVGELQYINYYGNVRKLTAWQKFKDQWRGRWHCMMEKKVPFDGLFDHSMDEYCKALEDGE
jgi:triacylglycerol lipase